MVQTPDGYLWFGTFNGLVRFDGIKFTVFDRSNVPQLPSAGIVNLYLDKSGRLWVSTLLGMAYVKDGQWHVFGTDSGWSGSYAKAFAETPSGELYIGTFNGHLNHVVADHFEEIPLPSQLANRRLGVSIHLDPAGALWLVHPEFIGRLVNGKWQEMIPVAALLKEDPPSDQGVAVLAGTAHNGDLLIATGRGIRRYRDGKLLSRTTAPWPLENIWKIFEDSGGTIWISSAGTGLYRVLTDGQWKHYTAGNGITYNAVRFTFEDRENNLWIGTSGGGLIRFKRRNFMTIGVAQGLPERVVKSVTTASGGRVLAGTYGGGVVSIDGQTVTPVFSRGQRERAKSDGDCNLFDGFAVSTLIDSKSRIWVGSFSTGLFLIENGKCQGFFTGKDRRAPAVASLFEDSHGTIWAGTTGAAMAYDGKEFKKYPLLGARPISSVHAFAEDLSSGTIWAGNSSGGILRLQGDKFVPAPEAAELTKQQISALLADNGTLWIGTEDGGLACLRNGHVSYITEQQGLPTRSITSILDDGMGNLWFGSSRGILRATRAQLEAVLSGQQQEAAFQIFNLSDGLSSLEFSMGQQPTATKDHAGRLWFATWTGTVMVNPQTLPMNAQPPVLAIQDVLIDGLPTRGNPQIITSSPGDPVVIDIPPGDQRIEIHYAGLSYTAPEKVRYRYQLEGLDKDWIDVGDRRVVYLQDVKPGVYQFRVKAANNDGVWNESGASMVLNIKPHFYETLWFYALCALAIALLALGLHQLHIHNLRLRQMELESRVAERTSELRQRTEELQQEVVERKRAEEAADTANRAKSTFLATMSHEIRTPMNGIIGLAELMMETPLPTQQRDDLRMIKASADSLLDVINDVLDFSKIDAGKMQLECIPFALRENLAMALKPFRARARQKGLELTLRVSAAVPDFVAGDAVRMRQVLVNLVSNAIKFTETGKVEINTEVEAWDTGEHGEQVVLHFVVTDTGIGVPEAKRKTIFEPFMQADGSTTRKFGGTGLGLSISSRLAEIMGGSIWVEHAPGHEGSAFHFTTHLDVREEHAPTSAHAGTQIAQQDYVMSTESASDAIPAAGLQSLHILVAEDNPVNQALALRLLEKRGHHVTLAKDGREALTCFEQSTFDLVLMDVDMPEMDGFEVTACIRQREHDSHLPIMAMTAHAMKGDEERCLEAGMDAYISKPIQASELFEKIETLMRESVKREL